MERREFLYYTAAGAVLGSTQSCKKRKPPLTGLPQVELTPRRTAAPVTYVIDYATTHLGNPEYLRKLAEAPPEFLHVGHDVPFLSAAGPSNPTGDRDLFGSLPLLAPAATAERVKVITKFVADVHAAGVNKVFPYICNQTIGGDPDKRLGFWAFYDRWNQYKEFGIPPKPPADPVKWMQRDPFGKIHFDYRKGHLRFAPQFRWMPCPNNEHWRRYLEFVVEQIAACGYDGVFVDNNILHCYCEYCQRNFQRYLLGRYPPEAMNRAFGTGAVEELKLYYAADKTAWAVIQPDFAAWLRGRLKPGELEKEFRLSGLKTVDDINAMGYGFLQGRAREYIEEVQRKLPSAELKRRANTDDLRQLGLASPQLRALWFETQRFWAWSIAENLLRLARAAAKHKPDFMVVPNWGAMATIRHLEGRRTSAKVVAEWKRGTNWMMFEEDGMPGRAEPGVYQDFQLEYKLALANGVRPVVLPYGEKSPAVSELAFAEAAAYGGGAYVQAGYDVPEIRKRYRELGTRHKELFDGLEPVAHVGLGFLFNQSLLENPAHMQQFYPLKQALSNAHYLWDTVTEEDLTVEKLSRYRVVVMPDARYLPPDAEAAIGDWTSRGGALIRVAGTTPPESAVTQLVGRNIEWTDRPDLAGLRAAVYQKRHGSKTRFVIHLLNYEMTPQQDPAPVSGLPVSIALPAGNWKVESARSLAPGAPQMTPLQARVEDGCLRFLAPEFRIYQIIEATAIQ
jgi:hypothetical protein